MGCDIHSFVEKREGGGWVAISEDNPPLDRQDYGVFAFLAGVRNYSGIEPISKPRGLPSDASRLAAVQFDMWGGDAHSASWLTVAELLGFGYDQMTEDRRYTKQVGPNAFDGGATCEPGHGERMTYREFLGEWFFKSLEALRDSGAERVVFWFDN